MSHTVIPTGHQLPDFRSFEVRLWFSRERAGITQQEMADLLGISRKTIQNYEAGVGYPKQNRLVLWANATDYDYDWLAGDFYETHPGARSAAASTRRVSSGSNGQLMSSTRVLTREYLVCDNCVAA